MFQIASIDEHNGGGNFKTLVNKNAIKPEIGLPKSPGTPSPGFSTASMNLHQTWNISD